MRVIAISAKWCDKCRYAKQILKNHDIEWQDIDENPYAQHTANVHNIHHLPSFIVLEDRKEPVIYNSALKLTKFLGRRKLIMRSLERVLEGTGFEKVQDR